MTDDKVNSPKHYNTGKIEVIDFIEDQQLGFHEGNVLKYVCRARHKGTELEDLKKAAWYLNRAIEKQKPLIGSTIEKILYSPARAIHIPDHDDSPICGFTGACDVNRDPSASTCIECKKILADPGAANQPAIHLVLDGKILCGVGLNPLNKSTAWLEETTCIKCKHLYAEKHE